MGGGRGRGLGAPPPPRRPGAERAHEIQPDAQLAAGLPGAAERVQ
jgi:hypothetical protein